MPLSDIEIAQCKIELEKFLSKHRPPVEIRGEVDLSYRINGQSVEIFEVRPQYGNSAEIIEIEVAKTTYVKTKNVWKVFWNRADLKWHSYPPNPTVKHFYEFLDIVSKDEHCCFFG